MVGMATSVLSSPKAAGTATSTLLQEMFVLEHPKTTDKSTKDRGEKKERKKREKRGYLGKEVVV